MLIIEVFMRNQGYLFTFECSAFNTIILDTLQNKLTQLSIPTSICQWITRFLTYRQQVVRLGKLSSSTRTISTEALQGCVLSPLLFSCTQMTAHLKTPPSSSWSLQTTPHWSASFRTVTILITDRRLGSWLSCAGLNNLELNTLKTVEMFIDFRRNPSALPPPQPYYPAACDLSHSPRWNMFMQEAQTT